MYVDSLFPGSDEYYAGNIKYSDARKKGEKLYDLFLSKDRFYSCAYWKSDDETLEQAQQNKVDHIIKKLGNIKPGSRVIDLGCGWGGMAFELAKQKGCEVTGISLSKNQIDYCKRKAKELGLITHFSQSLPYQHY